jgi:hypothetical protein
MELRGDLQNFPLAQLIQTLDSLQWSCGQEISLVDPLILLAVIFDNKAPIGAIRFRAKKISGSIKPALEKMVSGPRQELSQDLRKGLQDEVDNLF